ncbi:hypothetical protein BB561_005217 [Smittium simulii]|uniref:Transketolase-like pyrimidine-binding domain-containing protein n=1 Tax=Smittium simulii TaxID=133385 RepID=A0A2T9YBH5_9FUNG|nr:hypothetical protein BB561_005217 [Smittium simulii]
MLSHICKNNKILSLNFQRLVSSRPLSTLASIDTLPYVSKPKNSRASPSSINKLLFRHYHEENVYGHRAPVEDVPLPFNDIELANRQKNARLVRLVEAFKDFGYRAANLDPLDIQNKKEVIDIDPVRYGFKDPNEIFELIGILHINQSSKSSSPKTSATFKEIHTHLVDSYSKNIGYEFMHIPETSVRRWFSSYIESESLNFKVNNSQRDKFFEVLTHSEVFDHFMQKKFGQVKRYGLEGAESMMVALDHLINLSGNASISDIILGMPHRGRLNLLTAILKYPAEQLFSKLYGNTEFPEGVRASGDVISHLACETIYDFPNSNKTKVSLVANPSHLEAVNPVALGKARAKQMNLINEYQEKDCKLGDKVLSVQLHGDAAFTGQGVIMETLGLSNLSHYSCGGTIHIIVNNQIGYTTPVENSRSTIYVSDVAKMINAPIIHVNGDYPEDVAHAVDVAFAYRKEFRKDVIIDLVSFRRWGHNELDEPSFTQPLMYKIIRARKSVPKLYEASLIERGLKTPAEIESYRKNIFDSLEASRIDSKNYIPVLNAFKGKWKDFKQAKGNDPIPETGFDMNTLIEIGKASVTTSPDINIHPRLEKFHVQARLKKLQTGKNIDWATAEALAFGSLMSEGYNIRISGQDVGRGTFSQRHAMLVCQTTEKVQVPLNNLPYKGAGKLDVANSSLSEFAVLGFELGASWESPNRLTIWEAQFGDFNTTAQVIIDTYITSGETKWLRQSGLVMLLPHGYDGAGPEHSSCRIERFLQLSDDPFDVLSPDTIFSPNISVVYPTTPAQFFHLLRRQMKTEYRRPLIVAGPKTLLRLSAAASNLEEMGPGTKFQPVLDDPVVSNFAESVERVVFLSGKLYYDLASVQVKNRHKVSLVRIEELSPFPRNEILNIIEKYSNAADFIWCQEETQNAGSYAHMSPRINQLLEHKDTRLKYIGRSPLAAPVTGISSVYKKEQAEIISAVFNGL